MAFQDIVNQGFDPDVAKWLRDNSSVSSFGGQPNPWAASNAPPTPQPVQSSAAQAIANGPAAPPNFSPGVNTIYPGQPSSPQTTSPPSYAQQTKNSVTEAMASPGGLPGQKPATDQIQDHYNLVSRIMRDNLVPSDTMGGYTTPTGQHVMGRTAAEAESNKAALAMVMQHLAPHILQGQNIALQQAKDLEMPIAKAGSDESKTPEQRAANANHLRVQTFGTPEQKKAAEDLKNLTDKRAGNVSDILKASVVNGKLDTSKLIDSLGNNDFAANDQRGNELIWKELGNTIGSTGIKNAQDELAKSLVESRLHLGPSAGKDAEAQNGFSFKPIDQGGLTGTDKFLLQFPSGGNMVNYEVPNTYMGRGPMMYEDRPGSAAARARIGNIKSISKALQGLHGFQAKGN